MEVITDLRRFRKDQYPNLVVALGNFDGVHLGHQEILKMISGRARSMGGTSAVFTFKEHPQRVLHRRNEPPILTSLIHKLFLLKQAAVDLCLAIDFTLALSKKSPEDFVREILVEILGAREICLGFNARFGHDRSGDSQLMKQLARRYGFTFLEVTPFQVRERVVSSSAIRTFVQEGKLREAAELLGRSYSFFATVISGSGRGRKLGFPTANLDPHSEVMPPEGVYTVWIRILDCRLNWTEKGLGRFEGEAASERLRGLLNYGKRPTFGQALKTIPEVHILDFDQDLLGKTVEVTIGERLRSERLFPNQDALQDQIREDIAFGRKWFTQAVS